MTENLVVVHNGLGFETLAPESKWAIPPKGSDSKTVVTIGSRVTNQTQKPLLFNTYRRFRPMLMDGDGATLASRRSANASRLGRNKDFPIIPPGESILFFPERAYLLWLDDRWGENCLVLMCRYECGCTALISFMKDLKLGQYRFYFRYNNLETCHRVYEGTSGKREVLMLQNIWTGQVNTPLVDIALVSN